MFPKNSLKFSLVYKGEKKDFIKKKNVFFFFNFIIKQVLQFHPSVVTAV